MYWYIGHAKHPCMKGNPCFISSQYRNAPATWTYDHSGSVLLSTECGADKVPCPLRPIVPESACSSTTIDFALALSALISYDFHRYQTSPSIISDSVLWASQLSSAIYLSVVALISSSVHSTVPLRPFPSRDFVLWWLWVFCLLRDAWERSYLLVGGHVL